MHLSSVTPLLAALATLAAVPPALAQATDEASTLTLFGAQRFWAATQNVQLLDALIALPGPGAAPELRTQLATSSSSAIVPITSLGLRHGKLLITTSLASSTAFGSEGLTSSGQIRRSELDFSVGYALLPNLTASVIFKRGKFGPDSTQAASALLGAATGEGRGNAWLLGLSTSALLQGGFSIYGNLAYGSGRWQTTEQPGQPSRFPSRYTVADFGLAWRPDGAANVTLQVGYRAQVLTIRRVDLPTYSVEAVPRLLSARQVDSQSVTQGLIVSAGLAF